MPTLPRVVPRWQLPQATAQNNAGYAMSAVVGPALGTWLYQAVSRALPFVVDAVTHLVAQHVGDLAGAVGAPAQRGRIRRRHAVDRRDPCGSGLHPEMGWFEGTYIAPPRYARDLHKPRPQWLLRHLKNPT